MHIHSYPQQVETIMAQGILAFQHQEQRHVTVPGSYFRIAHLSHLLPTAQYMQSVRGKASRLLAGRGCSEVSNRKHLTVQIIVIKPPATCCQRQCPTHDGHNPTLQLKRLRNKGLKTTVLLVKCVVSRVITDENRSGPTGKTRSFLSIGNR